MKYLVAQLGARRHYAIPRMLYEAGILERFYTDICSVKGWPRFIELLPQKFQIGGLRRLAGRTPYGMPADVITSFTSFGLQYQRKRRLARTPHEITTVHLWAGKKLCRLVLQSGFGSASGVYTFNSAGLELLIAAREYGLNGVMEQTIAPRAIERDLLLEENNSFPDWQDPPANEEKAAEFEAREMVEWEAADTILCGSEFVRNGIAACGGPVHKCSVVPFGVDKRFESRPRVDHGGPLRVLTVGQIGLRKGSPYVLEAAKQLDGDAVFRMVGPIGVRHPVLQTLRKYIEITGPVPRQDIQEHFAWADVYLLPSICEGSSTSTYEALQSGLPVVCTLNTGSVVRHGIDGYVVPIRNSGKIVEALSRLANGTVRIKMISNAIERSSDFSLHHYSKRLISALNCIEMLGD